MIDRFVKQKPSSTRSAQTCEDEMSDASSSRKFVPDMNAWSRQRDAAKTALRRRFEMLLPDVALSRRGYTYYIPSLEFNLLPGIENRHFVRDFQRANGKEFRRNFLAMHSSAVLAVNTFARFIARPDQLSLARIRRFQEVSFEFPCPIGLRRGRAAHLDLLAQGPEGVVAVESKCTEYLQLKRKAPSFSPAYATQIRDERRSGPWFRAMKAIVRGEQTFQFLDAAQLIKHAFGLARVTSRVVV